MEMVNTIKAGFQVLKAGEIVANPTAWKRGQITVGYLVGFMSAGVALAKGFGYELPVTDEQLSAIATVILLIYGLLNNVVTVASTDKINIIGQSTPESVVPASISTGEKNNSGELGRYPPTPDKEKLQDDIRNTMARDSSLG